MLLLTGCVRSLMKAALVFQDDVTKGRLPFSLVKAKAKNACSIILW